MSLRGLLVIAACAASILGIGTVGAAVLWPELTEYSDVAQSGARPEAATPSRRPEEVHLRHPRGRLF